MLKLSGWLYQGIVFVLSFVLLQHVAPLFLQRPVTHISLAARAGGTRALCSLSFLDVYGLDITT